MLFIINFCNLLLPHKIQEWTAMKRLERDWQFAKRNCYRLSRVSWALAQISCYFTWKGLRDFLLVININLGPISHCLATIQPWPTDERTNNKRIVHARDYSTSKRRSVLLRNKVPFHRPYMARWCIKAGGDCTIATLAKQHKCLFFCVSRFHKSRQICHFHWTSKS